MKAMMKRLVLVVLLSVIVCGVGFGEGESEIKGDWEKIEYKKIFVYVEL